MREVLFWSRESHCDTLDWRPKSTLREMAGDSALGHPPQENLGTTWYEGHIRPPVVECSNPTVYVGYAPAVWGSASERE